MPELGTSGSVRGRDGQPPGLLDRGFSGKASSSGLIPSGLPRPETHHHGRGCMTLSINVKGLCCIDGGSALASTSNVYVLGASAAGDTVKSSSTKLLFMFI